MDGMKMLGTSVTLSFRAEQTSILGKSNFNQENIFTVLQNNFFASISILLFILKIKPNRFSGFCCCSCSSFLFCLFDDRLTGRRLQA